MRKSSILAPTIATALLMSGCGSSREAGPRTQSYRSVDAIDLGPLVVGPDEISDQTTAITLGRVSCATNNENTIVGWYSFPGSSPEATGPTWQSVSDSVGRMICNTSINLLNGEGQQVDDLNFFKIGVTLQPEHGKEDTFRVIVAGDQNIAQIIN